MAASLCFALFGCHTNEGNNEMHRSAGDVLASGQSPRVSDSVAGDAMLAGRELEFGGVTEGDYLGAGADQRVGGRIHGTLRAAGRNVRVTAAVDRNVTIAAGTVELDSSAAIGKNAYLCGGTVRVDAAVLGTLHVTGGRVTLNGPVAGDVDVTAGDLVLGPKTVIGGALRYRVERGKFQRDPAARIAGPVTALPPMAKRSGSHFFRVVWALSFLVVGAVLVWLFPRITADAAEIVPARPGRAALIGLAWIVVGPIAIILIACTLIGIPLALIAAAVYGIFLYVGRLTVAIWLGKRLLGARTHEGHRGALANFALGALLMILIRFIPVIGPLVILVATVIGLGALLLRVHHLRWSVAGTTFV